MLHSLAARVFLMIGAGATAYDAIVWVLRRFASNMRRYWFKVVLREVMVAL